MYTNRKVFRNSGPAPGAELRGIPGWHFDDYSGSFFHFPAQYIEEPEPGCVSHRPVECCSAIPCIHFFDADSIIVPDQLIGYFEVEVSSLVGDFLMGFGYQHPGFSPAVRAFNAPGEPLLSHGQDIPRLFEESGVAYLHTIGGSEKRLKPDIDTNRFIRWGQWFKRHIIAGESDKPLARRTSTYSHCLNISLDRARKPEFESADIPDGEVFAFQLPASLFQGEGVIAIPSLEPGKACFTIAVIKPVKEALVGFVQALNHVLKRLRPHFFIFRKDLLKVWKLLFLVNSRDGVFIALPDCDTLFQSGIVELAAQRKPPLGVIGSLRVGLNAILKGFLPLHDSSIANTEKGSKPYRASPSVSPALKSRVLDAIFL